MKILWFAILTTVFINQVSSQKIAEGKFHIDDTGNHFIKMSFVSQFWLRNGQYNPGTTLFGFPVDHGTDIGIRRFRAQVFGQLSDKIFFYSQLGINNFNPISERKPSFFVHDVNGSYHLLKEKLTIGIGLSGWSGLARFSSPAVISIVGIDAPLYQQTTNDATDQFLRKMGIFAKGKWGVLDYRLMAALPMSIQKSMFFTSTLSKYATFSLKPPKWQWNGYFQMQFMDKESNQTPYMTGTYLGRKKVFNIGFGFQYQPEAMWSSANNNRDTLFHRMLHLGADVYYDVPIGTEGESVHFYAQISRLNFGPGYIRNLGVMNPANGSNQPNIINAGGYGFPDYGTGRVWYMQIAYKSRPLFKGKTSLMPFVSWQNADYDRLAGMMNYYTTGCAFLLKEHLSKVTLAYESRPVFYTDMSDILRKGALILQYQIAY